MSFSDELKHFAGASADSKLKILRNELRLRIAIIRGFATLMQRQVNIETVNGLPEDFGKWIDEIAEAGAEMDTIIEILT
jgi:hypothetical protein